MSPVMGISKQTNKHMYSHRDNLVEGYPTRNCHSDIHIDNLVQVYLQLQQYTYYEIQLGMGILISY